MILVKNELLDTFIEYTKNIVPTYLKKMYISCNYKLKITKQYLKIGQLCFKIIVTITLIQNINHIITMYNIFAFAYKQRFKVSLDICKY